MLASYADLAPCYHALDLYLVPSRDEGGPLAMLEAMASGVPVVSTEVGMASDLIRSGENGIIAPVDDAEALADGAAKLLSDKDMRQRFASEGPKTVTHCNWRSVAERYDREVYRVLLGEVDSAVPSPL